MSIKISGVKKLKFNKKMIDEFIDVGANEMQRLTIFNAPEETSTLKNHGIELEKIENGAKVFLDTDAIKVNHPNERQRKRPDGGNYGYYQEVGWTQNGTHHPGKFYWDKAYDITEHRMDVVLKYSYADKIVTTE